MRKNLFDLDLQYFAEGEDAGANEVSETAELTEEETTSESEETEETGETEEAADPQPTEQSDEENARYAAIRRKAEEDARKRYESEMGQMNQQIAAMCKGITHPTTGQPITNVRDYVEALQIQQRQANEQELQEKGVDPAVINRMIESNPVVMQAQRVIEQSRQTEAEAALQRDMEELSKINPNIKNVQDLAALPTFPQMLDYMNKYQGMSVVDAYKVFNYSQSQQAGRQQAINQMRGKEHLASQGAGVANTEDYVEVPKEIMARWKSEGKTEKQIRELYKSVASKLHIN